MSSPELSIDDNQNQRSEVTEPIGNSTAESIRNATANATHMGSRINEDGHLVSDDRTYLAVLRLSSDPNYSEPDENTRYGYYCGRPIIGRESPINGGVNFGGHSREAIVIDDTGEYRPYYDNIYLELLRRRCAVAEEFNSGVLVTVFNLVKENMIYDGEKIKTIETQYFEDQFVNLGELIKEGVGVCRHQALLVGYLVERLKKDGYIQGNISVERNNIRGVGPHAWARYVNREGNIIIVDPAQDYCGLLESAPRSAWAYKDVSRPWDEEYFVQVNANDEEPHGEAIPQAAVPQSQLEHGNPRHFDKERGVLLKIPKAPSYRLSSNAKKVEEGGSHGPCYLRNRIDIFPGIGHFEGNRVSIINKGSDGIKVVYEIADDSSKEVDLKYILKDGIFTIGTSENNEIVMPRDFGYSAVHMSVSVEGKIITLKDLNSDAGFFIDGDIDTGLVISLIAQIKRYLRKIL